MQLKSVLLSGLGISLFWTGVVLGLGLSANVAWVESEARLYTSFQADGNLPLKCPFMLSPVESGVIRASVVNITNGSIQPRISAEISHAGLPRKSEQAVTLTVGESKTLEWRVDPSDVIFDRLILVSIIQSRYGDNPSYLGSCGILLLGLFGLSGGETFGLVFAASLIAMLAGGMVWRAAQVRPWTHSSVNFGRICATLMAVTTLALLSVLPRLWGLTIVLDAMILIMIGVILTDFALFPQKYND